MRYLEDLAKDYIAKEKQGFHVSDILARAYKATPSSNPVSGLLPASMLFQYPRFMSVKYNIIIMRALVDTSSVQ